MNRYLALLCLLLVGCLLLMVGLNMIADSDEQQAATQNDVNMIGTEAWCDAMVDKPNTEWTERSTQDFARHCLYE